MRRLARRRKSRKRTRYAAEGENAIKHYFSHLQEDEKKDEAAEKDEKGEDEKQENEEKNEKDEKDKNSKDE